MLKYGKKITSEYRTIIKPIPMIPKREDLRLTPIKKQILNPTVFPSGFKSAFNPKTDKQLGNTGSWTTKPKTSLVQKAKNLLKKLKK